MAACRTGKESHDCNDRNGCSFMRDNEKMGGCRLSNGSV